MTMQPAPTTASPLRRAARACPALLFAIATVLVVAACGGENGSSTPSSPTPVTPAPAPAPPSPRLVQQGTMKLAAPQGENVYFALAAITDSASGRWEATVDWTDPANELWMWVANGVCTAQQFARDDCPFDETCPCQFAIRSEVATPKPRVLTIPDATGGTRTLIALNLGPKEDTATYRVTSTPASVVAGNLAATLVATPSVSTGQKTIRKR